MPWHVGEHGSHDCDGWPVVKDDDGSVEGCHDTAEAARRQLAALYASENRQEPSHAPVEVREATINGVNFDKRLIDIIAVPYDEVAVVEYRGELWEESFDRGAFDGIEKRPNRVRANRDHDKTRTVGKVVTFWPDRPEGLVASVRIAPTLLGDETLTLADEDMLSASIGFAVRGSDQTLDRATMRRRIKRAFGDHLGFVESPAYDGARVLAVRDREQAVDAATLPPLHTPRVDEIVAWMASRRR
jgi:phage head maturation protease